MIRHNDLLLAATYSFDRQNPKSPVIGTIPLSLIEEQGVLFLKQRLVGHFHTCTLVFLVQYKFHFIFTYVFSYMNKSSMRI